MYTLESIETFNDNRSQSNLEYFILFAISVAGKTAKTINKALSNFIENAFIITNLDKSSATPFQLIKKLIEMDLLEQVIIDSKLGQHRKLNKAFQQLVESNIDLRKCTASDLESIHGIGKKTSRFFLLYNRRDIKCACLDTHILKYMRQELKIPNIPKSTPSGKRYDIIEKQFISHAIKQNKNPMELDIEIWKKYNKSNIK